MGRRMRIAPAALLAIAITLMAVEAHALFGGSKRRCDPTDNDIAAANMVIAEVEEMERAIIEALRLQTGQLAGYEAQSASAVTQALTSQTRLQAQIAREVEEAEALIAHTPTTSSCRTATGAAGLLAAREGAAAAGAAHAALETGRIAHDLAHVAPGGSAADTAARFQAVTATFCAEARAGQQGCTGAPADHGLDLLPGTLYDASTLTTAEDRQAAIELARNLAVPVVPDPIPWDAATSPAEYRRALVARAADARTALAADTFTRARAMREPAVDLGGWAAGLAPGVSDGGPLSRHALLEHLASRRFEDPGWFVRLEGMGTEALLRENARLLAVSLILDWERYLLEERRAAIEATRLAIDVEATRLPPGLAGPAAVN